MMLLAVMLALVVLDRRRWLLAGAFGAVAAGGPDGQPVLRHDVVLSFAAACPSSTRAAAVFMW